jgi:hypothetical protein
MCPKPPFYIYVRSGRLHFVKKKAKPLYPNAQVQTMVQFQVLSEVEAQ